MLPDYENLEADEIQNTILNAILDFKEFESIENLYIELKFLEDIVPEEQQILEPFIPCTHLLGSVKLIMQNGMESGAFGEFLKDIAENEETDSEEDDVEDDEEDDDEEESDEI